MSQNLTVANRRIDDDEMRSNMTVVSGKHIAGLPGQFVSTVNDEPESSDIRRSPDASANPVGTRHRNSFRQTDRETTRLVDVLQSVVIADRPDDPENRHGRKVPHNHIEPFDLPG